MYQPFERSMRSVRRDRSRVTPLLGVLGVLLLVGWAAWTAMGRVTVVASARSARVEARIAPHPVEAPISGRIARVVCALGEPVEAGDVLIEIDTEDQRLRVTELDAQIDAIVREVAALDQVIASSEQMVVLDDDVYQAEQAEAQAEREAAASRVRQLAAEVDRIERLGAGSLVSRADADKAREELLRAQAEERRAVEAIRGADFRRLRAEGERRTRIEELRRERAELDGRGRSLESSLGRLRREVEEGVVRSPISGEVGQVVDLRPGSYVEAGDPLTTVVPRGDLRVVAFFRPEESVGRVRAGQTASLQLDAYPWAQYGRVTGVVEQVGSEIDERGVRVEIGQLASRPDVTLQHGLTGGLEVEVERSSPWSLLMRRVGALAERGE